MGDLAGILIPIIALIVALIVVAGLWYWWTSNQPEAPEGTQAQPDQAPATTADRQPVAGSAPGVTGTVSAAPGGERAGGLLSSLRSGMSGVLSTAGGAAGSSELDGLPPDMTPQTGEVIEVLRLYRDLSSGALIVQIGRQKYYSLDEISEPQVRRRFLGNAEAMAQFAQLKQGDEPLVDWSAMPSTVNQVRPAYPADSREMPSMPLPAPPPMPLAPPPPMPAMTPAVQTGSAKPGAEEPPAKSIAQEIEELLQYRLALDPVFARRSIHIRPAGGGLIRVQVDNETFDGIGDVKDQDVRAFIQRVVQEWEARK